MGEAENVISRAKAVALNVKGVLERDGATPDDLREAAADFDDIEAEIERLLKDG